MVKYLVVLCFAILNFVSLSTQVKVHTAHACEGHRLKLSCFQNDKIWIVSADYGRWNASTCPYFDDPNMSLNCHSNLTTSILQTKCNGKQYCRMNANNENFRDPCPGQVKYAEVQYTCIPLPKSFGFGNSHISIGGSDNTLMKKGIGSLINMLNN